MKTDALLQLPHLWNATKKGSLSRSNQHLPGDVENHAYLGGVPVSFQNMNQFILFCWLAARQFWLAAVICNPGWAQIIISNDFCHHPGWGGDINTQTADGVAASSLTWLHTSGCSWVLLLVGLCSVTPPPWPPGREPDDPPPLPSPIPLCLAPSSLLHTLPTCSLSLTEAESERDAGRRESLSWPTVDPGGDTWRGESWSWTRRAASWAPLLMTLRSEGYTHALVASHLSFLTALIPVKASPTANSLMCFLACISEGCWEKPEAESFLLNPLCFVVLLQPGLHKAPQIVSEVRLCL